MEGEGASFPGRNLRLNSNSIWNKYISLVPRKLASASPVRLSCDLLTPSSIVSHPVSRLMGGGGHYENVECEGLLGEDVSVTGLLSPLESH